MKRKIEPLQVLELLKRHVGKAQGLKSRQMVKILTGERSTPSQERGLRHLVSQLRLVGFPICATPEHGYWWAETVEEIQQVASWHRSRSLHSLKIAGRLKKYGVPLLSGQLTLAMMPEVLPQAQKRLSREEWGPDTRISLEVEIPYLLYQAQRQFQRERKWSQARLITAALTLFLMQEGSADLSELYEDVLEEGDEKKRDD